MSDSDLRVFISWSGKVSKRVALVWQELLRELFDTVTPWMSDTDIEAGTRGLDEIKRELDGASFGIIVVTQKNQNTPWINFEAGALSKSISDAATRVVPSLVGFTSEAQLNSPLTQFQATLLNEDGVSRTVKAIAAAVDLDWENKKRSFQRMWPDYNSKFKEAATDEIEQDLVEKRTPENMLEEVLTILRDMQRTPSHRLRTSTAVSRDAASIPLNSPSLVYDIRDRLSGMGIDDQGIAVAPGNDGQLHANVTIEAAVAVTSQPELQIVTDEFAHQGVAVKFVLMTPPD